MNDLKLSDLSEEAYTPQQIFDQVWESNYSSWFKLAEPKYGTSLPAYVSEVEYPDGFIPRKLNNYFVTAQEINDATLNYFYDVIIKNDPKRKLVDWVEGLDASDVDAILQYVCFGEIRYS